MRVSRHPSIFDCGNMVCDPVDPRHVGRVEHVEGNKVLVHWSESGFWSDIVYRTQPQPNLQRVDKPVWVRGVGHIPAVNH